jgi:hypothetical protein
MLDRLSEHIILHGFQSLLILCALYGLLRFLFRKSLLVWSDPLNIALIFASFGLAGFLMLPLTSNVGSSYWIITILVSVYFFTASKPKISVKRKEKKLNIKPKIQILFSLLLLLLMIVIVANDIISGNIPILRENGLDTRFEGTDNRYIFMLFFSISGIPLVFFSLSEIRLAKKISFLTILLVITKNIFLASKSAIFFIPILLINYHFLLSFKVQNVSLNNDESSNGEKAHRISRLVAYINTRKNKIAISIGALLSTSLTVLPIYMSTISSSSKNAFFIIFARLFAGYDNFIFVSESNIPMREIMLDYGMSIWTLYFLPVFKILFNFKPQFNSIPEFIIYKTFGIDQELLKTRPIPNSNVILESVLTSGIFFGTLLIIIFALTSFLIRKCLLEKSDFLIIDVILFNFFVMSPLGWFTEGSIYFNYILCSLSIYLPFVFLINVASLKFHKDMRFKII